MTSEQFKKKHFERFHAKHMGDGTYDSFIPSATDPDNRTKYWQFMSYIRDNKQLVNEYNNPDFLSDLEKMLGNCRSIMQKYVILYEIISLPVEWSISHHRIAVDVFVQESVKHPEFYEFDGLQKYPILHQTLHQINSKEDLQKYKYLKCTIKPKFLNIESNGVYVRLSDHENARFEYFKRWFL